MIKCQYYKLKKIIYAHKYNQLNRHFFERIPKYLRNILENKQSLNTKENILKIKCEILKKYFEKPKHKNITINI